MISFRFFYISMSMILLFFGIGLIVGSIIGSEWLNNSYQSALNSLEDKITDLTHEKKKLEKDYSNLNHQNENLLQSIISLYKKHYSPQLEGRSGVLLTKSAINALWLNGLQEIGLKIEPIDSIERIQTANSDFIVLEKPSDEWYSYLVAHKIKTPMVIIGEREVPAEFQSHAIYFSEDVYAVDRWSSFLDGIQILLSNRDEYETFHHHSSLQ
jgi:hypothetical protein